MNDTEMVDSDINIENVDFNIEKVFKKKEALLSWKTVSKLTGTKKCGCPFNLRTHKLVEDDDWILEVVCGMHNNPPVEHLEGHSYAGRLSEMKLRYLWVCQRVWQKVIEIAGRSQMQQLLIELEKCNYIERHRCDEKTMTLINIFWAHPMSTDIVVFIDDDDDDDDDFDFNFAGSTNFFKN
ncbi:uncharacterized protein LOC114257791 [Camellia sinensis]|uniref:uncharacterized protein LOC114257791 n=1 Tax=Camellia sinensis TaxID=4442 RepID=UPI0010355C29|nr:uncharacterized protein LOC114257791 [Camellia sinensis]